MAGLDLNLISLFVDIAEAASLSDAARRVGVTRSHISQRLRMLEHELGADLMRRTTRKLELTEAGQTVYDHGLRMREAAEAAASAVGGLGRDTSGLVRLSIPTGLGRTMIGSMLLAFQQQHANINLTVRFSNRVDDLVSAQIDIAVKIAHRLPDHLTGWELGRVGWSLCASPAYLMGKAPIRASRDLAGHGFICPPIATRRLVLRAPGGVNVNVTPRLQSEDFGYLVEAAEAGIGIGLLPAYMVAEALKARRLLPLLPAVPIENPGSKLFLVTAPITYPTAAQRMVIAFLRQRLLALFAV